MTEVEGITNAEVAASTSPAPPAATTTTTKGSPNDFLKKVIGKHVIVRLNSGVDYHGVLSCLDGFMNIALEETQEFVEGIPRGKYGDAFIRGNNGMFGLHSINTFSK